MKNKQKLNINQWSKADRPREKMMAKGAEALSDAELLGILIGSGNTEESAVELTRRVLASCDNNLNELGNGKYGTFPRSRAWDPPKVLLSWQLLNWGKGANYRKAKSVNKSDAQRTFTGCSTH